ncbi:predicted protein [Nematostella vectensis]|uniref:DNA helicase n=1 Tax=Nematostella vectensis TaxID=45351 RepID=A7RH48_NEMVE|nr:X-ray repair cross-complementing protein 6 [Nematostella vectensis]EDO49291.1 predicted protein [Nematostella vectensis]|eukprot:XP_001641354.1 predicted protein [Nematostella vectensis]
MAFDNFGSAMKDLFDFEDGEEETETSQESGWQGKDCLLFAIDCSPLMFKPVNGEIPFQLVIKCAINVLKNKIISSDKDLMAIVFFATEKHKNKTDFKHVYILQELDQPDASRILELEKFLEDDNCNDFSSNFGHNTGFSLSDVLWTCSNIFSQCTQKVSHKRIMLFTNCDHPHIDDLHLQKRAKTKAEDLREVGINIELLSMLPAGGSFDPSAFYQDIVVFEEDEDGRISNAAEKFEELLRRVQKKDHKKRSMGSIPFTISEGVEFGVNIFNLCRSATKSSYVNLDSRTNEDCQVHTKYICKDTGAELMPTDIKFYQKFGGEKIIFEKEEVASMKKFGDPGLLLMGFKPRVTLKRFYHVKPAHFIYPDEKSITGSTTLFSALLTKCLDRDVVPICRYIPRGSAAPSFVALLPQEEEYDDSNVQVTPPGFHVIFLPFADDMRKLKYPKKPEVSEDQIEKAQKIIRKLHFTFDSTSFENPTLQKHFNSLEALALDRDAPEEVNDLTVPDVERIDRRAGELLQEFKELVYPENYDPEAKAGAKRKAGAAGGAAKRGKQDGQPVDIRQEALSGRLSKLTVPVLREFAKQEGIKCGTKKADLVDAINRHFGV